MAVDHKQQSQQSDGGLRGCGCHLDLRQGKARWVLGAVALVIVGAITLPDLLKGDRTSTQTVAAATNSTASAVSDVAVRDNAVKTNSVAKGSTGETIVGTAIGTLAELNGLAAELNAVLVFLPAKDRAPSDSALTAIDAAKQNLEARFEIKIGLFTLMPGSRDYHDLAAQMSPPGMVAIVKTG